MKIRHLQKVAATVETKQEEEVSTDTLFNLIEKAAAQNKNDSQTSVILGKWSKTALNTETTTAAPAVQLSAPRMRKASAQVKTMEAAPRAVATTNETLKSHNRQEHTVYLSDDGSVLSDRGNTRPEIRRLNFGIQYDNHVSVIIADFSALCWANKGKMEQYTPVISFYDNNDPLKRVYSYAMDTSEQWPNDLSAEFYIPKEITSITNGLFLFSLQEKGDTNNINGKQEIWVSKTVNFYTTPNIFTNNRLTQYKPTTPPLEPDINSLAYLSKNRIGIQDLENNTLGHDFSFGGFPIVLGSKFDQYVKLMKLPADLMWNYECSQGFLLLEPSSTTATYEPTVCKFQLIADNYYCMLPPNITQEAQNYTIAIAIADNDFNRIYWSSNQTATVINNFLSSLDQLTINWLPNDFVITSGLITADNYTIISADGSTIDTIEND